MKKRTTIILILTIIISMFSVTLDVMGDSQVPQVRAKAAAVYCPSTNEILMEKGAGRRYNLASITKLMTCYIALENLSMDQVVEISPEAENVMRHIPVVRGGQKVSVKDLVHEALLISANDSAKALALAVSGTEENFAKLMNAQAKEWGLDRTRFKNSTGLSSMGGNLSSAMDVARMASIILEKNKDIREVVGTRTYETEATDDRETMFLKNTNLLLRGGSVNTPLGKYRVKSYDGVFGGKTGNTETNMTTLVVGLNVNGIDCYGVILASTEDSRYKDMIKLLDFAKENVSSYKVFKKGAAFGAGSLKYGAKNKVVGIATNPGYINLPEGASASLITTKAIYEKGLKAPIKKGQVVGKVEVYLADELIRTVDLVSDEDINRGWFLSAIGISNLQTVLIFLVIFLIIGLMIFIKILKIKAKKRKMEIKRERLRKLAQKQLEIEEDRRQREWPYR